MCWLEAIPRGDVTEEKLANVLVCGIPFTEGIVNLTMNDLTLATYNLPTLYSYS